MKNIFLVALLGLTASSTFAGVYECTVNGKTSFQSKPCSHATVAEAKTLNSQSIRTETDFSKMQSQTYPMNFSECKSRVLSLQLIATRHSYQTTVMNDKPNSVYSAKVCASDGAVLMTCSAMDRKMSLRKMAKCEA